MALYLDQIRGEINLGPLHVWAGEQLSPQTVMVVGHSHEQPHLMLLLNPPVHFCPHCNGELPLPKYRVLAKVGDKEKTVDAGPYGVLQIPAGVEHSVEQLTPGAKGGFLCIFSNFDASGNRLGDPKKLATPGVTYTNG